MDVASVAAELSVETKAGRWRTYSNSSPNRFGWVDLSSSGRERPPGSHKELTLHLMQLKLNTTLTAPRRKGSTRTVPP